MKRPGLLLLLFLVSCSSVPQTPAVHARIKDSDIIIDGLDKAIIAEINRGQATAAWESLLPVYRMPADTDMKDYQPVQHGIYKVKDSLVVFRPDTPLVTGQTYFVRYYRFDEGSSASDYIRGIKKLNTVNHTDLVLKKQVH